MTTDFKAKPEKTVAISFEVKSEETVPVVLRLNQETRALVSICTVQTAHGVTRPLDRLTTEYPTCATISDPLQQVSYSCHDPRRCLPYHTCHLHTTRQANTILHMNKDKSKATEMSRI
jgi:hypothetical protein